MLSPTQPYRKRLADNLVLRSVADQADVERVAAFNGVIHGAGVAAMTRELILRHPDTRPEHWLFVEDEGAGQVVSSICLIPWTLRYEDVQLKAGEVGIVGTLPAYRHRGLVRAQFARHEELLCERGDDLGIIQGIPYFYRQFGYEYAMALEGGWHMEPYLIPDTSPDALLAHILRLASPADVPALTDMYERAASDLDICAERSAPAWYYLLGPSLETEMVTETWLVCDSEGRPSGYFRVPEHGFGEGLIVNEVSRLSADAALAVLRHVRSMAVERSKPYVRLCLPEDTTLVQAAVQRGAHSIGHYAWQIHIVDVARFVEKLAPLLERRLAASPFSGLTQDLCLNLYREAWKLRFERGQLEAVEAIGFSDESDIRLPPLLAAPLLLGYRSREDLMQAHHDVSVRGEHRYLVDVLFPKVSSFLYTIY